ncbi:MAG: hypothetical protein ACI4M5_02530 [Christensenellales bacterium]
MKKRIVLAVIIVLVICLTALTGCSGSSPIQKKLGNSAPWISLRDKTETTVYQVAYTEGDVTLGGTYTLAVNRIDNAEVALQDKTYSSFTGYVATGSLVMDNGDTIDTKVLCNTNMQVQASYSKAVTASGVEEVTAQYANKDKVYYTYVSNGETVTDDIKIKDFFSTPYTDNAMLYLLARSFPTDTTSFSIDMPDFKSNKLNSVLLSKTSSTSELTVGDTSYSVATIELSINRTFPGKGTPLKCYVSNQPINDSTNAIVKIIEGNVTYTLDSVSIA